MTKHNLVIHTIAKDEEHIINEWILHNIFIGFEHIFIYDDISIYVALFTTCSIDIPDHFLK
jgi:hypothetical protein